MKQLITASAILLAGLTAAQVKAATLAAYAVLDRQTAAACIKASGLRNARVGEPVRFSDNFLIDARMVTGVWPQAHMKGAPATMLCVYNRRTKHAETQEVTARMHPAAPVESASIKDVWWRAEDIGGGGVIDNSEVTVQFGADGKVAGRSGCNNYSANYQLTGDRLKVFPPMIGTRMMCPPALMNQEAKFQRLLSAATGVSTRSDGGLVLSGPDGKSLRFVRR